MTTSEDHYRGWVPNDFSGKKWKCGSAHHINFRPLLEHWSNECQLGSQGSSRSEPYFEFVREEESSPPGICQSMSMEQIRQHSTSTKHSVVCKRCNKKWAIDELFTPESEVPSYTAPKLCCLQVSDTGKYMSWEKVTSLREGLREGDQVAFLRCFRYWHHAVVYRVNGDDDSFQVVHWTCKGIRVSRISRWSFLENCCWSPTYKVYYPKDVEEQNPWELVLLRAKYWEGDTGYHLCYDNCEHFATFSKTGEHKSNQIYQWKVSLCGWMVRIIANFVLLALAVVISEFIEEEIRPLREIMGAICLGVFEFIYVIIFCGITIGYDIPQETFNQINRPRRCYTPACD